MPQYCESCQRCPRQLSLRSLSELTHCILLVYAPAFESLWSSEKSMAGQKASQALFPPLDLLARDHRNLDFKANLFG